MNKIILVAAFLIPAYNSLKGQEEHITGKPITEIYTDFHINLNDSTKYNGFDLNRAYLGYQYLPDGDFSAKVIVNVGSPSDLAPGSSSRRYAYFREASVTWMRNGITITMGMTGTRVFDFQQKFWGKRYLANTFQSLNGYGYIADIGLVADFEISKELKADFSIMNGEGFTNIQLDNMIKTSAGLTFLPSDKISLRFYNDIQKKGDVWQYVCIAFAGLKTRLITVGGEINYKSNLDAVIGHHAWGFSGTGGINITEKNELFVRYDYSSSVVLPGDELKWNHLNNGSFFITGLQHTFTPNIKIALDYQ